MVNTNKFSLEKKIAIVTGAAGFLGKEHCLALSASGARVVMTDVNQPLLDKAFDEVQKAHPEGEFEKLILDVTSEESVKNCLVSIVAAFKKVDILVNNAAIDPKVSQTEKMLEESRFENFDLSSWNFQVAVGLTGAMLCSKHFGTHMADNGGGVILNIASDLSVISPDQRLYKKNGLPADMQPVKPVTYSVIKSGLIGLTKYLSTYWADKSVRVNALSPGGVFNNQPSDFVDKLTQLIPLNRMATKEEYRSSVQFLCSDASSYMTGQNLVIDGGRSVW
jgi:NAD(P)-dependent dehydrogenase (short-subunit alcohol dehydrogenase family)